MSDDTQQPIVVKRIKKGGGGHHGGAWKIAYADFVTAMMAFFLLMWLLGSTAQGDLEGHRRLLPESAQAGHAGRRGHRRQLQHHQGRRRGSVAQGRPGAARRHASTRAINLDAAPAQERKRRRDRPKEGAERASAAS
jgi:chemotaxis protein MotB